MRLSAHASEATSRTEIDKKEEAWESCIGMTYPVNNSEDGVTYKITSY